MQRESASVIAREIAVHTLVHAVVHVAVISALPTILLWIVLLIVRPACTGFGGPWRDADRRFLAERIKAIREKEVARQQVGIPPHERRKPEKRDDAGRTP